MPSKAIMSAMKKEYQRAQHASGVKGEYVELVQRCCWSAETDNSELCAEGQILYRLCRCFSCPQRSDYVVDDGEL